MSTTFKEGDRVRYLGEDHKFKIGTVMCEGLNKTVLVSWDGFNGGWDPDVLGNEYVFTRGVYKSGSGWTLLDRDIKLLKIDLPPGGDWE